MDMDSEIIETLNTLRPPVKRLEQEYIINSSAEGELVRDSKSKTDDQKNSKLSHESSFSLILQKTFNKQIFEKYSFVNSEVSHRRKQQENLSNISNFQNKPTVRITVIPKKYKKSTIKLLQSQDQKDTKTEKSKKDITTANDENYIATKNVFLIVAGSKEKKIYEIKTISSSKTFKVKARNVKKVNNSKSIVLNMDKKKIFNVTKFERDKYSDEVCLCNCRRDSFLNDVGAESSRVRIFGRIGLNENDNYVMKCAATVNGHPVTTDYIKPEQNLNFRKLLEVDKSIKTVNESQATQVDIGLLTKRRLTLDRKIQCNSKDFFHAFNSHGIKNDNLDKESQINTLKGSHSPLVIISVYPNQEVNTLKGNKKSENTSPKRLNNNQTDQSNLEQIIKLKNFGIKTDLHKSRERSPKTINAPQYSSEANKKEEIKNKNTNLNKPASRSPSPANKSPKSKIQECKKPVSTENYYVISPKRLKKYQTDQSNLDEIIKHKHFELKTDLHKSRQCSPIIINAPHYIPDTNKTEDIKNKNTNLNKPASRSPSPANKSPKSKIQECKKPVSTENYYVISPKRLNKYQTDQSNLDEIIKHKHFELKTDLHKSRQRSPIIINAPHYIPEANKTEDIKNKNTYLNKPASRSVSPANKSKLQERKKPVSTDNYYAKSNNTRNQSPNRLFTNGIKHEKNTNVLKENKGISTNTNNIEIRRQRNANMRSKSKSRDENINAVKVQTNSAEKFTKRISNLKKTFKNSSKIDNDVLVNHDHETIITKSVRKSYPKNNVSKVSINIDSEKEFYDVIFEKGKFSTDLFIRKTTKETGSQKYFEESFEENFENNPNNDCMSDSLENFFPLEVSGRHRRSVSQAFNDISDDFPLSEHTISRLKLNVRDSLEIGHRREDEKDLKAQPSKRLFQENNGIEDNEGDFSAPVKHFTGDNCIIGDPIERDKKIRELLGIDVKRTNKKTDEIQHKYRNDSCIRKTFSESLVTSQMLRKCSCSTCSKIKMTMEKELNDINVSCSKKQNNSTDFNNEKNSKQVAESSELTGQKNHINSRIEASIVVMQSTEYEAEKNKKEPILNQKHFPLSRKQYRKVTKSLHKLSEKRAKGNKTRGSNFTSGNIKSKLKHEYSLRWDKEVQTDVLSVETSKNNDNMKLKIEKPNTNSHQENTIVLYSREKSFDKDGKNRNKDVENVASSVELRCTNFKSMTEVKCSRADFENLEPSSRKKYNSIETIFRGQKKSHTPNLGPSAISLLTEDVKSESASQSPDSKRPKKPFLRRLMSCLVMRSATSEMKLPKIKRPPPTVNSSIDSYHINTSIGGIEMSSSMYDTSASFYSNYSIGPVNKGKRGFISSVLEFLTTKKS